MDKVAEAVELFRKGCACSQAILAVYGEPLGIDRTLAMKIAAGFAGGMCVGEICGAVTGAYMVLGLKHSGAASETSKGRAEVYAAIRKFNSQFKKRNDTIVCKELLRCDLGTPEGERAARKRGVFGTVCPKAVQDAAEILEEML